MKRANSVDEDLHSRQIAVYGRENMKKLAGANVLITGINGLGAEIVRIPPYPPLILLPSPLVAFILLISFLFLSHIFRLRTLFWPRSVE